MNPASKKLLVAFSKIRPLPPVVIELSRLLDDASSTIKQFVEVIEMDPVLVARLLKIVNSPLYGPIQKIDSINRAVIYLGIKNLNTIVVTEAVMDLFKQNSNAARFSREKLWLHSVAVAVCAKMIAERIFAINGDDAYLSGILHDFGLIIEEQIHPETFYTICKNATSVSSMRALEQEAFATDHCELGYLITQQWTITEPIREAIRDQHTLLAEVSPSSLTGILQIAGYLVSQHGYPLLPHIQPEITEPLLDHIEENHDEYQFLLNEFPEEMAKVQDLYHEKS
ncbi:MAG: signal transduction protein [Deltaproteobacteria bacterium]|nr:MAG: signal transduction protein [Deltaproteobacteria bacterium]